MKVSNGLKDDVKKLSGICTCSACENEQIEKLEYAGSGLRRIVWVILFVALMFISSCLGYVAHAESALAPIPDDRAILAIIGESENQGKDGMLAVACALRNRGTLKGVYGEKNRRVKGGLYTKGTYLKAQKAWLESKRMVEPITENCYIPEPSKPHFNIPICPIDPTQGANSWENINEFGKPDWADTCEQRAIIKDHVFYYCKEYDKKGGKN